MTAQMGHADWNGFFHHDTIFPLFLFIAGISFPFSLAKQREKGMSERSIYLKVIRRGLTLVALGFVYSGLFKLDFATLRLPSSPPRSSSATDCCCNSSPRPTPEGPGR